ncbi:35714_t:CDS:2, partial [Racocetra persica]
VSPGATPKEITSAYRKLALVHHPDKGGSNEKFQEINEAYENLMKEVSKSKPRREFKFTPGADHFKEFEEFLREMERDLNDIGEDLNDRQKALAEEAIQNTQQNPYSDWKEKFRKSSGDDFTAFLIKMSSAIEEARRKKGENFSSEGKPFSTSGDRIAQLEAEIKYHEEYMLKTSCEEEKQKCRKIIDNAKK